MKKQKLATNAQSAGPSRLWSNVLTLDEIHRRSREIHIERGDHSCDLDDYLDEWVQAERELRERSDATSRKSKL